LMFPMCDIYIARDRAVIIVKRLQSSWAKYVPDLLFYRGFVSTSLIPYFATVIYSDSRVLQTSFHAPLPHWKGES